MGMPSVTRYNRLCGNCISASLRILFAVMVIRCCQKILGHPQVLLSGATTGLRRRRVGAAGLRGARTAASLGVA